MKKKILLSLTLATMLLVSGCGTKTESTVSTEETSVEATVEATVESSTEPTVEASASAESSTEASTVLVAELTPEEEEYIADGVVKGDYTYVEENGLEFNELNTWFKQTRRYGKDGMLTTDDTAGLSKPEYLEMREADTLVDFYVKEHDEENGTKTYVIQISNDWTGLNTGVISETNELWDAYTGNIFELTDVSDGTDVVGSIAGTKTGSVTIGDKTFDMTVTEIRGTMEDITLNGYNGEYGLDIMFPYNPDTDNEWDGHIEAWIVTVPEEYDGLCVATYADAYAIDGIDWGCDENGDALPLLLDRLVTGESAYTMDNLHIFHIDENEL